MIAKNEVPITVTNVFTRNRNSKAKYVLNRGGAGSSKSYSVVQLMIEFFFVIPDIKILILRKTQPALRLTTLPLFESLLDLYGLRKQIKEERGFLNFWNGKSLVHFQGLDDVEKIKSSDWNVVFIEEATELTLEDVMVIDTRLRAPIRENKFIPKFRNRIFMCFNPTDEFSYLKTEIIEKWDDVEEIVSTWRDNPFLSDAYIRTLLDYEKKDKNKFRIYSEGSWGHEDHVIFNNWETISDEKFKTSGDVIYGLDFGYTAPSALLKIYKDNKDLYCKEFLYKEGMTNTDLIVALDKLISNEERRKTPIYCDNAEPARIDELDRHGFWVIPSDKDTKAGIDYCRGCNIYTTKESPNFIKELKAYTYKKDKDGRILEEPTKQNDHLMSCLRYAVWTDYILNHRDRPRLRFF